MKHFRTLIILAFISFCLTDENTITYDINNFPAKLEVTGRVNDIINIGLNVDNVSIGGDFFFTFFSSYRSTIRYRISHIDGNVYTFVTLIFNKPGVYEVPLDYSNKFLPNVYDNQIKVVVNIY